MRFHGKVPTAKKWPPQVPCWPSGSSQPSLTSQFPAVAVFGCSADFDVEYCDYFGDNGDEEGCACACHEASMTALGCGSGEGFNCIDPDSECGKHIFQGLAVAFSGHRCVHSQLLWPLSRSSYTKVSEIVLVFALLFKIGDLLKVSSHSIPAERQRGRPDFWRLRANSIPVGSHSHFFDLNVLV